MKATENTSAAPSLWPLLYYLSLPLGLLLYRGTCPWVCSAQALSIFNKGKNKNERWTHPPSRAPVSGRIHWEGDGNLSLPQLFFNYPLECCHLPLSATTSWPLQASLSSALKSSQWPQGFWLGWGPLWPQQVPSLGWSSVSRGQGRPAYQETFPLSSPCGPSNRSCAFPWVLPVSTPNVYFSGKESQRNPGKDALQRALFNWADSTITYSRLAWDHVALAFLHCPHVRESEVGRRERRQ